MWRGRHQHTIDTVYYSIRYTRIPLRKIRCTETKSSAIPQACYILLPSRPWYLHGGPQSQRAGGTFNMLKSQGPGELKHAQTPIKPIKCWTEQTPNELTAGNWSPKMWLSDPLPHAARKRSVACTNPIGQCACKAFKTPPNTRNEHASKVAMRPNTWLDRKGCAPLNYKRNEHMFRAWPQSRPTRHSSLSPVLSMRFRAKKLLEMPLTMAAKGFL